ncbi:hypothetical protein F5Y18DRAFT_150700 [Xylariaceae sp. FL1019]|nr:hypothetical protein F5Y18DRAFT_150700 [Xylariaceae sp. FL1019]
MHAYLEAFIFPSFITIDAALACKFPAVQSFYSNMDPSQLLTIRKRKWQQVAVPEPTHKDAFLSLPEHIRCRIIDRIVVGHHPLGSMACQWIPPALAQVNRRFREETIPVYYRRNKFILSIQVEHQVEIPAGGNFGFGALCGMFDCIKDHLQWVSDITVEYQIETPSHVLCVGAGLAIKPPYLVESEMNTHSFGICRMGEAGTNWTNLTAVEGALLQAAQLEYAKQTESRCMADTQIRRVAKVLHLMANYCVEATCGQGWFAWKSSVNQKPEHSEEDFAGYSDRMTDPILSFESALEELVHYYESNWCFLLKLQEGPGAAVNPSLPEPLRLASQIRASQTSQPIVPTSGEGNLAPQKVTLGERIVPILAPQSRTPRGFLPSPPLSEEDETEPQPITLPVQRPSKRSKTKDVMGVRCSRREAKTPHSQRPLRRSARLAERRKNRVNHTLRSSLRG